MVWLIFRSIKECFHATQFFRILKKGCFIFLYNLRATKLFRIWSRENLFRLRNSGQNLRWAAGGRFRRRWGGRRRSGRWGRRRPGTQGVPLQAGVADPDPGRSAILCRIRVLRIHIFKSKIFNLLHNSNFCYDVRQIIIIRREGISCYLVRGPQAFHYRQGWRIRFRDFLPDPGVTYSIFSKPKIFKLLHNSDFCYDFRQIMIWCDGISCNQLFTHKKIGGSNLFGHK